jgi:hypothetical protein
MIILLLIGSGSALFGTIFLIYRFVDDRTFSDAFYGACMILSLLGQDDPPENDEVKVFIGLLGLLADFFFFVLVWMFAEKYVSYSYNKTMFLGLILGICTFLTYFLIEERDVVNSFYGTCMLIGLIGQDEKPVTMSGQLLLGLFSLISSFVLAILAWVNVDSWIRNVALVPSSAISTTERDSHDFVSLQ